MISDTLEIEIEREREKERGQTDRDREREGQQDIYRYTIQVYMCFSLKIIIISQTNSCAKIIVGPTNKNSHVAYIVVFEH